jgi:hypothetical protein
LAASLFATEVTMSIVFALSLDSWANCKRREEAPVPEDYVD